MSAEPLASCAQLPGAINASYNRSSALRHVISACLQLPPIRPVTTKCSAGCHGDCSLQGRPTVPHSPWGPAEGNDGRRSEEFHCRSGFVESHCDDGMGQNMVVQQKGLISLLSFKTRLGQFCLQTFLLS